MKFETTYTKSNIWQAICCLLIVLLLLIPLVQSFHFHEENEGSTQNSENSVVTKALHCSVCSYLAQVKSKEMALNFVLLVLIPGLYTATLLFLLKEIKDKFSIRKSVNKGPPEFPSTTLQA